MQDALAPVPEPTSSCGGGGGGGDEGEDAGQSEQVESTSNCTICRVAKLSALDMSSNEVMQRRLRRDWKMAADVIQSTLKTICVECVCKLNMHSEVTRSLMQRMQRLQRQKDEGKEAPIDEGGGDANVSTTTITHTSPPPIADAEVSTTLIESQDTMYTSSSLSTCSELEAYSSQPPESPTATESGGIRNNSGPQASNGWKWRTRLLCQYCGRAYFRKDYFTMHSRRCWRRNPQHTPANKPKCRVLNEAEARQEQDEPVQHLCNLCGAEFDAKYEWELHHTICSAKQEALEEETGDKGQEQKARRSRSLRSRSRACSVAWEQQKEPENNDDDDEEEEEENEELLEHDDDDDDDDEEEDDDDDDDAVSTVDTMYSRRMNFTGDWVVNHSRSNSNSALNNLCRVYDEIEEGEEEMHITSDKEYDLYLLDLLKKQVKRKSFTCFVPSCGYKTTTLETLMYHDYMNHWKMSWFYCQKCGDVFTSKVFLDYHLHRQNRGYYICHKCQDEFVYQHQLDHHLLLHSKGINYYCNYCRLEFLSETKLLAHCRDCGHSPNEEPPLIHIDRTLSFANNNTEASKPERPQLVAYAERELILPHVKMPTTRPMHLANHKPFRFAIGIVNFDNRNPPNCVGCQ
ncbi:uncharacterized protein Dwil_GK20945 [Drosophila willistoni]|uniref:C2H2-type domain-containing protein n=2 Tax=Drosophila willistoni TaxID=7260 RepID=B4MK62_DROWI|nr:uncharacterized protein Dwil_GK20945 [Drosophila willistoni]